MIRKNCIMSESACIWMYLRILYLHQRPIRLMMFLSTPEQSRDMVLAAQREQAEISLASNPRFGAQKPKTVLRVFNIIVGVIFSHLPDIVMKWASGVEGGAPQDLRWLTCRRRVDLGHKRGSTDALCQIPPPLWRRSSGLWTSAWWIW